MIVGVDGCKGGWIAVSQDGQGAIPDVAVHSDFKSLLANYPNDATICVDMPIGLPEQGENGGRSAERAVRALLKKRRSSVFAIPSRSAVYAAIPPFEKGTYVKAHARACVVARETSTPPAGFPIQAFGIFPKIREIDALLRTDPNLKQRVFESHPEFAFCILNGLTEMQHNKTLLQGEQERCLVLSNHGLSMQFLTTAKFEKAKRDDFLDACVMMLIAKRILTNSAKPYPNPPIQDAFGLPIAIWA